MFGTTSCSGPCETCRIHYGSGCLAGHGDDDYTYASPEWIATEGAALRKREGERLKEWRKPENVASRKRMMDAYDQNIRNYWKSGYAQ